MHMFCACVRVYFLLSIRKNSVSKNKKNILEHQKPLISAHPLPGHTFALCSLSYSKERNGLKKECTECKHPANLSVPSPNHLQFHNYFYVPDMSTFFFNTPALCVFCILSSLRSQHHNEQRSKIIGLYKTSHEAFFQSCFSKQCQPTHSCFYFFHS